MRCLFFVACNELNTSLLDPTLKFIMNRTVLFAAFVCLFALGACNNENNMPEPFSGRVRIDMSANLSNVVGRADVANFPNAVSGAAQVAVLARKTAAADWSNPYINNAIADVGASALGYSLTWAEGHDQFWPSNGDELTFAAYSPVSVGGSGTTLNVELTDETPDVIVALTKDGNAPVTGKKPASGQSPSDINFFFEHVLSQLQVKVKNNNKDIVVSRVDIIVASGDCAKVYDISSLTWTPGSAPAENKIYKYSKMMGFGNNGIESVSPNPVLLFPGTQSSVTIELYNGIDLIASKPLNEFKDSEQVAASLVAGKKTTVIITVADNSHVTMTAGVSDWEELGEYETIV